MTKVFLPALLLLGGCFDFLGLGGRSPDAVEIDTAPPDSGGDE